MPWLVPACSHASLKEKIEETQQSLFCGMNIAGLIPGFSEDTDILDASAYLWECDEEDEDAAPLAWTFEFQRDPEPGPYSLTKLSDHLEAKCDAQKKINTGTKKFHSMLVVLTGSVESECRMWLQDDDCLRIILMVGSEPA